MPSNCKNARVSHSMPAIMNATVEMPAIMDATAGVPPIMDATLGLPSMTSISYDVTMTPVIGEDQLAKSIRQSIGVVILLVNLLTICFNIVVASAFIQDPLVREPAANFYILNLCITDLLTSLFCVPLYSSTFLLGRWPYGFEFCVVFIAIDSTARMETTLTLVLITHDRYMMANRLLDFNRNSRKRVFTNIAVSWICTFIMRVPFVVYGEVYHVHRKNGSSCSLDNQMEAPYRIGKPLYDKVYVSISVTVEFIIPMILILMWNVKVYRILRRRITKVMPGVPAAITGAPEVQGALDTKKRHGNARKLEDKLMKQVGLQQHHKHESEKQKYNAHVTLYDGQQKGIVETPSIADIRKDLNKGEIAKVTSFSNATAHKNNTTANDMFSGPVTVSQIQMIRSKIRRSARILLIMTIVFVVFRLPYLIVLVVASICWTCVKGIGYEAVFWIEWSMSLINPFLYAFICVPFKNYCERLWQKTMIRLTQLFRCQRRTR